MPTRLIYLFYPLCGWCYGASAMLEQLVARPDPDIALAPTGLFAGGGARPMGHGFAAYAWANDQRITRLSGQPFSEVYCRNVLGNRTRLFDFGPATIALTVVALTAPDREFEVLKAVQIVRYVEGRDTTAIRVLSDVLRAANLPEVAERLIAPNAALIAAYRAHLEGARTENRRFGANAGPPLVVGANNNCRVVQASALFGRPDGPVEELKAA